MKHYETVREHWLSRLYDICWDNDVPWGMVVPRFQWEDVLLDAISETIGRAYDAGRRSALGEADPYWQPPAAPESIQRHNDNADPGRGPAMEEVPDGF